MSEVHNDLTELHHKLEEIFDSFYAKSDLSFQNDSVFDDIIREIECALGGHLVASEPEKQDEKVIYNMIAEMTIIDNILTKWMENRDELRSRGAGMHRAAIPIMKKEVLAAIYAD